MIPCIIHQIHLGHPPSDTVRGYVATISRHNPTWSHIIWDMPMLAAIGFKLDSGSYPIGSWAAMTNKIRLELLLQFGGVYLDTDFESLAPLDIFSEWNSAIAAQQDGGRICNAFMAAPPQNAWIRWQLEHFADFPPNDAASGVYLATAAPRESMSLIPQEWVYPWLYDTPAEKRIPHRDSLLIHHWAGSWVRKPQ